MAYLLLILTAITAISIQIILAKKKKEQPVSISDVPVFNKSSIYAPKDYQISKYHTWIHPTGNTAKVGIDNFAVKSLGNILIKNLAKAGNLIKAGDEIIEAEVHGQKLSFKSPINGIVKAINKNILYKDVEDAYGNDWAIEIESSNGFNDLKNGSELNIWLRKELRRFKDFLSFSSMTPEAVGVTMYDGGNFVEGIVSTLNKNVIIDFQEQFLNGNENV